VHASAVAARQLPRRGAPGQRLLGDDFNATTGGSLGRQRLDDEASGTEWLDDDLSISLART
jgi:hypothetical protein